jgi:hypothetical protein
MIIGIQYETLICQVLNMFVLCGISSNVYTGSSTIPNPRCDFLTKLVVSVGSELQDDHIFVMEGGFFDIDKWTLYLQSPRLPSKEYRKEEISVRSKKL